MSKVLSFRVAMNKCCLIDGCKKWHIISTMTLFKKNKIKIWAWFLLLASKNKSWFLDFCSMIAILLFTFYHIQIRFLDAHFIANLVHILWIIKCFGHTNSISIIIEEYLKCCHSAVFWHLKSWHLKYYLRTMAKK